jgi:hypothetical protein
VTGCPARSLKPNFSPFRQSFAREKCLAFPELLTSLSAFLGGRGPLNEFYGDLSPAIKGQLHWAQWCLSKTASNLGHDRDTLREPGFSMQTARSSAWACSYQRNPKAGERNHCRQADRLETEFICLPRPIVRQDQPGGGPILYRVRHTARLWRKHERPNLEQKVIEGNPAFSI